MGHFSVIRERMFRLEYLHRVVDLVNLSCAYLVQTIANLAN